MGVGSLNSPSMRFVRRRGGALCAVCSSEKVRRGGGGAAPEILMRCVFRRTLASSNGSRVFTRGCESVNSAVVFRRFASSSCLKTAISSSWSSSDDSSPRRRHFCFLREGTGCSSSSACVRNMCVRCNVCGDLQVCKASKTGVFYMHVKSDAKTWGAPSLDDSAAGSG